MNTYNSKSKLWRCRRLKRASKAKWYDPQVDDTGAHGVLGSVFPPGSSIAFVFVYEKNFVKTSSFITLLVNVIT